MPTTFLFTRHGEPHNPESVVYGPDTLLNNNGRSQMKNLGLALNTQGIKIDVIYTSPLIRAKESAKIISEELSNKPTFIPDERLTAADTPKWYDRPLRELYDAGYRDIWSKDELAPEETPEQVDKRLKQVFDEIHQTHNGKTVLIVGHEQN